MNDRVLNEMKVVVERAVRPVRVGDARKMRIREELLDHFTAIYEEELERSSDEQAALRQAKERFGNPRELSDEMRQSVSRLEFIRYLGDLYRYRPGVSLLRFALGHLLMSFVAMIGMFLVMLPVIWIRGRIGEIGIVLHVATVTWLFSAGFSFSFVLIAEQMGQVLYGQGSPQPVRAIVRCSLASLLVFPLLTAFTYAGLMLSLSYGLKGLLLGCAVAPAAPLLFYMLARQMKEQISRESEWSRIEIEE